MGFFNKILVQDKETGNLIDITNLDQPHYESFLDAMDKLRVAYCLAIERRQKADTGENNALLTDVSDTVCLNKYCYWNDDAFNKCAGLISECEKRQTER